MPNLPVFALVFKTFNYFVHANAGTCTAERFLANSGSFKFQSKKKKGTSCGQVISNEVN